jgi:hypothetical protein
MASTRHAELSEKLQNVMGVITSMDEQLKQDAEKRFDEQKLWMEQKVNNQDRGK